MTESIEIPKWSHRELAVSCFNQVWDLLDKVTRTEQEDEQMAHLCHTSYWHWTQTPEHTVKNLSIGCWQLARVYAVLGRGETALRYAKQCKDVSLPAELAPFYKAYAFEAEARALQTLGLHEQAQEALQEAKKLAELITDLSSQEALLNDLKTIEAELA
ncbi:hypothetical protein [Gorillibacterium sp. CAU 1737]|uniref:hypothetical protein n=1 Tax=Gorillibacterium sp. CAU 1737 TaxID=3140362 RepID=UPI0032618FBA